MNEKFGPSSYRTILLVLFLLYLPCSGCGTARDSGASDRRENTRHRDETASSEVRTVVLSAGGLVAFGSADGMVVIQESRTRRGEALLSFSGGDSAVTSLSFSPEDRYLASGCENGEVRLWELRTGREIASMQDHHAPVESLVFSPDGKYLVTVADSSELFLYELPQGLLIRDLSAITVRTQEGLWWWNIYETKIKEVSATNGQPRPRGPSEEQDLLRTVSPPSSRASIVLAATLAVEAEMANSALDTASRDSDIAAGHLDANDTSELLDFHGGRVEGPHRLEEKLTIGLSVRLDHPVDLGGAQVNSLSFELSPCSSRGREALPSMAYDVRAIQSCSRGELILASSSLTSQSWLETPSVNRIGPRLQKTLAQTLFRSDPDSLLTMIQERSILSRHFRSGIGEWAASDSAGFLSWPAYPRGLPSDHRFIFYREVPARRAFEANSLVPSAGDLISVALVSEEFASSDKAVGELGAMPVQRWDGLRQSLELLARELSEMGAYAEPDRNRQRPAVGQPMASLPTIDFLFQRASYRSVAFAGDSRTVGWISRQGIVHVLDLSSDKHFEIVPLTESANGWQAKFLSSRKVKSFSHLWSRWEVRDADNVFLLVKVFLENYLNEVNFLPLSGVYLQAREDTYPCFGVVEQGILGRDELMGVTMSGETEEAKVFVFLVPFAAVGDLQLRILGLKPIRIDSSTD